MHALPFQSCPIIKGSILHWEEHCQTFTNLDSCLTAVNSYQRQFGIREKSFNIKKSLILLQYQRMLQVRSVFKTSWSEGLILNFSKRLKYLFHIFCLALSYKFGEHFWQLHNVTEQFDKILLSYYLLYYVYTYKINETKTYAYQ